MNKISSLRNLLDEYGSKIIEIEVPFDEVKLTYKLINQYLNSTPTEHLDFRSETDEVIYAVVGQYGIGNYIDAYKDLEEYSVIFN